MDKLKIGIGVRDAEKLEALPVKILGASIEMQKSGQKEIGDKVVFICKHPTREESIKISATKYVKDNKLKTSGTWFMLDADGKIAKNSALAMFLKMFNAKVIDEMVGKDVNTIMDERGFLAFKAY